VNSNRDLAEVVLVRFDESFEDANQDLALGAWKSCSSDRLSLTLDELFKDKLESNTRRELVVDHVSHEGAGELADKKYIHIDYQLYEFDVQYDFQVDSGLLGSSLAGEVAVELVVRMTISREGNVIFQDLAPSSITSTGKGKNANARAVWGGLSAVLAAPAANCAPLGKKLAKDAITRALSAVNQRFSEKLSQLY